MRLPLFLLVSLCGPAFAQDDLTNVAAEAAKRRIATMNLLAPRLRNIILMPNPVRTCAIPLLNALPKDGVQSRMPVLKPAPDRSGGIVVPMPACDEIVFGTAMPQNK